MNLPINKIIQGDVIKILKTFPSDFIDCIITSPPYYGLRDYGEEGQIGLEKTLEEYIEKLLAVTSEIKRVMKPTATLWWNHGDSYGGSGNGSWNAPIEIRGKQYRKNISIDQEYLGPPRKDKTLIAKCATFQNYRLAIRMIDEQKFILRNTIIWHKPNCMPASVKDRFTVDYEPIFFFTKSKKYYFKQQYEFFQSNDYDRARMAKAREVHGGKWADQSGGAIKTQRAFVAGGKMERNKRCVWSINTHPFSEAHFATFPPQLLMTPILAGCPKNGIVLDPFFGSGTTGLVAKSLDRNFIGIELNGEYIKLANNRLAQKTFL